ncbi:MAG: hypothetical protein AB7I27_10430 [Bacteriovoracaceae bacterium]
MKKLTCAVLLIISTTLLAIEIEVSKMKNSQGMERSFDLTTSLDERVVLDCQSFIQGLMIGEHGKEHIFMLDAQECQDIYGRINSSLNARRHHCIDVEDAVRGDYTCN